MKNYAFKEKKNANEVKVLKSFFGILLFVLALFFSEMLVSLPQYIGAPLAVIYLFVQYRLWIGDSGRRR